MAECDWAILCDYAFLDIGRKMCLIGIFDRVFAAKVPATHHQASLAMKFVGEPHEKVAITVEIVRPTGGTLAKMQGEVLLADSGTGELQLGIAGLPLPDYGLYSFNIYIGDALAKTAGFSVTLPPQAPTH